MKQYFSFFCLLYCTFSVFYIGCNSDGVCTQEADLFIPPTIVGQFILKTPTKPFFYGNDGILYPPTQPIYVTANNFPNTFFSVDRFDPNLGQEIEIHWNNIQPPPFFTNGQPPFHPLDSGEVVTSYKFARNDDYSDIDCLFNAPPTTSSVTVVKYENGQVESSNTLEENTPGILSGQVGVTKFKILYQGFGNYELIYKANINKSFIETDTTNNIQIDKTNTITGKL